MSFKSMIEVTKTNLMRKQDTMKTKEEIYDYFEEAINAIPKDHPNYHEVRRLLISQVNDELHDHATYNRTDRRAS